MVEELEGATYAEAKPDRSEVDEALVLLRERVDYLEHAVTSLEKKIGSVMTPAEDFAEDQTRPELHLPKSPLTGEIDSVRGRLEALTRRVEWIGSRIAL